VNSFGNVRRLYLACLRALLRPAVRFSLRRSTSYQDVSELLKQLFVEEATAEIARSTEKINVSRISALTGLNRKEVTRLYKDELPKDEPRSVLSRVIYQWEQSDEFTTKQGKPRVLSFEGERSEFHQLVLSVSSTLNPGTVLFELERAQLVERTPRGLKLKFGFALSQHDPESGFKLLGKDMDALLTAVEENVFDAGGNNNLHLSTYFDNLYLRDLPEVRKVVLQAGREFHANLRKLLAEYDKDANPDPARAEEPAGATIRVGAFAASSKRF